MEKSKDSKAIEEGIQSIQRAKERLRLIDQELLSLTNLHKSLTPDPMDAIRPSTRALSHLPKSLFECNLIAALTDLSQQWLRQHIVITFNHIGLPIKLDFNRGTLFLKCIQECLDLSVRHLEATHILIELSFYANTLELYIEDNGTSLNFTDPSIDFIRHRILVKIDFMDGLFEFERGVSSGNVFTLIIPRIDNIE